MSVDLKTGFGMTNMEVFDFLRGAEKKSYDHCIEKLKSEFSRRANATILTIFKDNFQKGEDGKMIDWRECKDIAEIKVFVDNA